MDNKYEMCLVNIKKDSRGHHTSYITLVDSVATCDDCFCGRSTEGDYLYCCDCIFEDDRKYTKKELILDNRINRDDYMAMYNVGIREPIIIACDKDKNKISCDDVLCSNADCANCKLKLTNTSELEKLN